MVNIKSPTPGAPTKTAIESHEAGDEYEQDDFEKDDLVQMAEPNVARQASIGSKKAAPSTI